ncbi:MAG: hypothetical protein JJE40_18160 [Vicinamibacteria bacterium]|nr:hypothetical protein [Vicinamibacteria bacterium]
MTGRLALVALAAASLCVQSGEVIACGDKFLVASRGTRFQRAGLARQPAAILLYANPASRLAATLDALSLPGALIKVGYAPTTVVGADALARAMRERTWDLVLVDLADSDAVRAQRTGRRPPALMAVAYDVPGDVMKQARREHDAVIRKPGRTAAVVDAIDEVLFDRTLRATSDARKGN